MGRAVERRAEQYRSAFRSVPGPAAGGSSYGPHGGGSGGGRRSPGRLRRLFGFKRLLGLFFGLCLLGMGAFVVLYVVVEVPEGNAQAKLQSNVYKYSDGTVLARTGKVNREIVDLSDVPKDVQRTFVAAENKSFYKDQGVDLKGTARGLFNTLSGKGRQSGSTITQQYVKNYYLDQDQTVTRKLKELVIALKVDRQKSKDEILAGYINTSYYGRGAYGIQAAAQAYYGKDAHDLDVDEGAYLAALLQAPSQYDWASATDEGKRLAKARWNYVLDNMVEMHWLDAGERQKLTFPIPRQPKPAAGLQGQEGYLVQAAEREIIKDRHLTEAEFEAGGWTITLSVDREKQRKLENAVAAKLTDALHPKTRRVDGDVQAGAVSVDPKTGGVVALYGGRGLTEHWTSNATRKDYQPASTFKPVILAAAFDRHAKTQDDREITADTIYDGTSRREVVGSDRHFAPPNEDGVNYGPVTVQKAMNKSINSVFAQMGVDVGMDHVMETAGALGMDVKDLPVVPAQTLGSMGASPMEMAGIYATLDNHGKLVTPHIVKEASHDGDSVELPEAIGEQAISREAADSVTSVLTGVVRDGTGAAVRNPVQEVAGKTGTADENKSAWFSGYTPKLVTSVGLFGEAAHDHKDADGKLVRQGTHVSMRGAGGLPRVDGASFPARIWAAYTFAAMGAPSEFDLDTDTGAGVESPPAPTTSAPSQTPEPTSSAPQESIPPVPPPSATLPPPSTDEPSIPPTSPGPTVPEPPEPSATVGPPSAESGDRSGGG